MITTAELHRVAEQEGLRFDQVEKDYVILWLLSGLVHLGMARHGWIFKGGTCLRHCYYKGYRFSEDIDFSCKPGRDNLDKSLQLLQKSTGKIQSESGIRITVKEPHTIAGDFQIEIPVEYSRGGTRRQGLPQVKVHLTFDEPIFDKAITVQSNHNIPTSPLSRCAHTQRKKLSPKKCVPFSSSRRNGHDREIYTTSGTCCATLGNISHGVSYCLCLRRNVVSGTSVQILKG